MWRLLVFLLAATLPECGLARLGRWSTEQSLATSACVLLASPVDSSDMPNLRILSATFLIVCAGVLAACADSEADTSSTPLPPPGLALALEVGSPQGPEGSIPLTFVLHNPGDHAVTIHPGGGCPGISSFDLTVERDGKEVWSRFRNVEAVCGALLQLTLEPDQQETFGDTWDRRDNDGQSVSPGTYKVTGVLKGETEDGSNFELRTQPQEFEVS